jgi:hypothetical protein
MEINIEMVRSVFSDVLNERMTREAADRWAYDLMQRSEAGSLTYSPVSDKDRIWAGIMYLYGIDNMVAPREYLHTEDDIRTALVEKLGAED